MRRHAVYVGDSWGFVAVCGINDLRCNRYGTTPKNKSCPNKGIQKRNNVLKCNCPWVIRYKQIKKKSSQMSDNDPDSCATVIHSVVAKNGNGCDPGIN